MKILYFNFQKRRYILNRIIAHREQEYRLGDQMFEEDHYGKPKGIKYQFDSVCERKCADRMLKIYCKYL